MNKGVNSYCDTFQSLKLGSPGLTGPTARLTEIARVSYKPVEYFAS